MSLILVFILIMGKRHFIVSIKTIDDMKVFPADFNGVTFLLGATANVGARTGVIFKGYASPTLSIGIDSKQLS